MVFGGLQEGVSSGARDLVAKMLTYRPAKRITAAQALAHPWLSGGATADTALSATKNLRSWRAHMRLKKAMIAILAIVKLDPPSPAHPHSSGFVWRAACHWLSVCTQVRACWRISVGNCASWITQLQEHIPHVPLAISTSLSFAEVMHICTVQSNLFGWWGYRAQWITHQTSCTLYAQPQLLVACSVPEHQQNSASTQ